MTAGTRAHARISRAFPENAGPLAALYIEATEKLAADILAFQAKMTGWAKDTPLAAVLEARDSMACKLVKFSAGAARRLWRIEDKPTA